MPKSKEFISSTDSDSDEDQPRKKVKKVEAKKSASSSSATKEQKAILQLSKMRYISVSEFRGKKYVNIREYYDKDGEMRPGKKGIALNEDQWQRLKEHMEEIDSMLNDK